MATESGTTDAASVDHTAPRRVSIDNQSVEANPLKDQMDAADRTVANTVAAKRRLGIRFSRIRPGDAV